MFYIITSFKIKLKPFFYYFCYRYYAAPEDESYVHVYTDTDHRYSTVVADLSISHYDEITDPYEER